MAKVAAQVRRPDRLLTFAFCHLPFDLLFVIYSPIPRAWRESMSSKTSRILLAIPLAAAGLNFSCSNSTAPQPGTPAYYWAAANETSAANDYVKTSEHLSKLLATDN